MTTADPVVELAPAKVNLTLHITGRRDDGYHLLDSLVMFADAEAADVVTVTPEGAGLRVTGPKAPGVPLTDDNLAWRAASAMGATCGIHIEKQLPSAAGIGGGTADGAAVLRALARLGHRPLGAEAVLSLGADMPICLLGRAARMEGVGEVLTAVEGWPALPVVLVNPGVSVPTGQVFQTLASRDNGPMPATLPRPKTVADAVAWLGMQRNDLEAPAKALAPEVSVVLEAVQAQGAALARMSGSGATCFGVFDTAVAAERAAIALARPGWWVAATTLR